MLILPAQALNLPYDEHADAWTQVKKALAAGKRTHKPTLLVFGANWCTDCRALDKSLRNQKNTALIAKHFEVVKIDVGNFDRNLELSQAYGDPIQDGIPGDSCGEFGWQSALHHKGWRVGKRTQNE